LLHTLIGVLVSSFGEDHTNALNAAGKKNVTVKGYPEKVGFEPDGRGKHLAALGVGKALEVSSANPE